MKNILLILLLLLYFDRLTNVERMVNDDNDNYYRRVCLPTEAIRLHRVYVLYLYIYNTYNIIISSGAVGYTIIVIIIII